jgi:hypothetical protein
VNTDLSVAPEIAMLADPFVPAGAAAAVPRTDGRTAADLSGLAATPELWWDLVRFDAAGPARIPVPDAPGAWLLVLPPGATADCDCQQATALAGEAVEAPVAEAAMAPVGDLARPAPPGFAAPSPDVPAPSRLAPSRPLRPGRVRVRGTRSPHRVRTAGPGYSVTLHWSGHPRPF